MKLLLILLATILPFIFAAPKVKRESSLTTERLVEEHGYPFEEHSVQTSDGYILAIHRIPYSPRVKSTGQRPVAFLMHGILSSSSDWTLLGPDNGLAYILSDAGFDVWMGNARGNRYSRKHVKYNPLFKSFWDFTWHEIGMLDLPAMIDYVRFYTDEDQVTYFAHSQGTTAFLVLNSLNLNFKNRIKSAHLLAPVAFSENMESPLVAIAAPILGQPNALVELFGNMEFLPSTRAMELLGYLACRDSSPFQDLCSNALFLISGADCENFNKTLIPDIMATSPSGSSINQIYHFLQGYNSGYFRQFDYGLLRNKLKYGTKKPPNYPLEKIDVPLYLYYSDNDYMASVVDVHRLIRTLSESTIKGVHKVPHPKWNHLDFLWGNNIHEQVYHTLIADVAKVEKELNHYKKK